MYPSYEKYLVLKRRGLRAAANEVAKMVVEEYNARPDFRFIDQLCADREGHKINYIFWRGIVVPYVKEHLDDSRHALKCLIMTMQNLCSDKDTWESLRWVSKETLLRQYLEYQVGDPWAMGELKRNLRDWLRYTIHEWPSCLLYGADGATLDECDEILAAVREYRELDRGEVASALADDVENKTNQYKQTLANNSVETISGVPDVGESEASKR